MAWWIWVAFAALGAAVALLEVRLLKRLLTARSALSLMAKIALWAAAAVVAVLVNPQALLALIAGSAPVYALSVYAVWRHRGD